ncbi:RNA-binding protein musashi isoform X1 [Osmia lignaria lignaria]|uniref:RNA-binding protein Musashi homolog 2 isoform X1 n=2 Tax=Osmia bicornis bicornis TaxID=1437191 RepID=UPI0010F515E8|nr:RNA-binding protein Musashi homolog 2 isoform X1 [Osmia bicornis bicornis]XP_029041284.1 RNA-binding protein Musashi homolog 2 isoform X1 [Osmia bicornis bicornis]XP_029041285.1 RNA-binding protein Musashi homolog 2 isoform X1 [Osmia bicornis bicornis]XP_034181569.1 RNA-binding protein Musashi homolog 2 isoform X1 [Osmia lignaria]XP_034181570.1 RNA-binding protein Musashi homolog 2 isoform X1 [Osmia lignaria]XP_034181571.1 RNA-binding protein Musashi homolog 2 isoform X1 [Osmia lignaria]XP
MAAASFPPNFSNVGILENCAGMEAANGTIEHDFHNALVPINGSHSGSSGRSTPNGGDPAPGKLFVGGLSWQTSSEKLREYFGMFGTVTDVLIMKDPVTQRSRGFGFITFAEPGSVDKVLKCPIHTLDGKKIDPKHATPKNRAKQANRTKKIFVGGVSQDTSSEEVKAYFNQFGKVEETVMLMDQQTKRHRGFGFVTFENEDVVDRVCEIHFHTIKNKKVECKKAQPKEAVQPGALALGKRVVLGALGVRLAPQPPLPVAAASQLVAAQAQAQVQAAAAAAAAAQVQNAVAGYGKLFASSYPALSAYRYAPYPIPAAAVAAAAAAAAPTPAPAPPTAAATPAAAAAAAAAAPANPYQGYSLTNVDMSSFQGVDWGSMYGMGMYV